MRARALLVTLCGAALVAAVAPLPASGEPSQQASHDTRFFATKGQAGKPPAKGRSPNLLFHNGQIMTSAALESVFWGPSWASSAFTGDKQSGLHAFYVGADNSSYMGTNTEYTGTNGQVTRSVSVAPDHVDLSATPPRAPSTSTVLAAVARNISNPVANGYYPVYTDIRRGSAGYCAWHSYGTIGNVPVQFGFFFDLDGDSGCDPADSSLTHSQGLAALANVSGHELSEAVTDPRNGGWYDSAGYENADKCAWKFSGARVPLGGDSWKLQGNWSNAAYNANLGYVRGCVDGT